MYFNKFSKIYIVVALFPFSGFGQNQNLNYSKFKQLKEEVAKIDAAEEAKPTKESSSDE